MLATPPVLTATDAAVEPRSNPSPRSFGSGPKPSQESLARPLLRQKNTIRPASNRGSSGSKKLAGPGDFVTELTEHRSASSFLEHHATSFQGSMTFYLQVNVLSESIGRLLRERERLSRIDIL